MRLNKFSSILINKFLTAVFVKIDPNSGTYVRSCVVRLKRAFYGWNVVEEAITGFDIIRIHTLQT